MKNILLIIWVFVFFLGKSTAQDSVVEALKMKMSSEDLKEKVFVLIELANTVESYEESIEYCNNATEISKNLNDDTLMAYSMLTTGTIEASVGKYSKAEKHYLVAIDLYKKINDSLFMAYTYYTLAISEKYWGKYRKALEYAQQCYDIYEKLKSEDGLVRANQVFGYIYQVWDKPDQADIYFKNALKLLKGKEEGNPLGYIYLGHGNVLFSKGKLDSALILFEKSNKIFVKTGNRYGEALTLRDIGRYYIEKKDFEKAELDINQSLTLLKLEFNYRGISQLLVLKGDLYFLKQNYNEAVNLYLEGQKLALEMELQEEVSKNYKLISTVYEKMHDNTNALKYFKRYADLRDSLFSAETFAQLSDMQTKYETEKKEKENQQLRFEIELKQLVIKRQYIIVVLIFVVLILAIAISIISFKSRQKEKTNNLLLEKQNEEIQNQRNNLELLNVELNKQKIQIANRRDEIEAELKETLIKSEILEKEKIQFQYEALKNQVNPHFLFNNFSTIANLIPDNPEIAEKYVLELSNVYRYILSSSQNDLQDLKSELKFIDSYMFLVNIKFNHQIKIEIDIPEEYQEHMIPLLSLQLLVENAIKHNVINTKKQLFIAIKQVDNFVEVKNNRNAKALPEKSTGIGLQNIVNRYKLLTDQPVEIDCNDEEFTVRLPLLKLVN